MVSVHKPPPHTHTPIQKIVKMLGMLCKLREFFQKMVCRTAYAAQRHFIGLHGRAGHSAKRPWPHSKSAQSLWRS